MVSGQGVEPCPSGLQPLGLPLHHRADPLFLVDLSAIGACPDFAWTGRRIKKGLAVDHSAYSTAVMRNLIAVTEQTVPYFHKFSL